MLPLSQCHHHDHFMSESAKDRQREFATSAREKFWANSQRLFFFLSLFLSCYRMTNYSIELLQKADPNSTAQKIKYVQRVYIMLSRALVTRILFETFFASLQKVIKLITNFLHTFPLACSLARVQMCLMCDVGSRNGHFRFIPWFIPWLSLVCTPFPLFILKS